MHDNLENDNLFNEDQQKAEKRLEQLRQLSMKANLENHQEYFDIPAYLRRNMEMYSESSSPKVYYSFTEEGNSLPLFFSLDEYSNEEIVGIISMLSELYREAGGDELKIKFMSSYEFNNQPQAELV